MHPHLWVASGFEEGMTHLWLWTWHPDSWCWGQLRELDTRDNHMEIYAQVPPASFEKVIPDIQKRIEKNLCWVGRLTQNRSTCDFYRTSSCSCIQEFGSGNLNFVRVWIKQGVPVHVCGFCEWKLQLRVWCLEIPLVCGYTCSCVQYARLGVQSSVRISIILTSSFIRFVSPSFLSLWFWCRIIKQCLQCILLGDGFK